MVPQPWSFNCDAYSKNSPEMGLLFSHNLINLAISFSIQNIFYLIYFVK